MIHQGVPEETLILILMLPVVTTVIAFFRHIIGVKAFGIYAPLILTFAFVSTGIKYGIAIFLIVLLTGTLVRFAIKRLRLLYLPRMAIVLTVVSLAAFLMFLEGSYAGRTNLILISILPILIMITLVEKFLTAQIKRGGTTAIILTLETLIISVICYHIITWPWLKSLILTNPGWVVAISILINIFLGKWTGLRLAEYLRFKEVIKR